MDASDRFGIEEGSFVAEAQTRGTPGRAAKAFHAEVHERLANVDALTAAIAALAKRWARSTKTSASLRRAKRGK